MLEGTGDMNTGACERMRPIAKSYAFAYNQTLLRAGLSVPAGAGSIEIPCPTPRAGYVCHVTQFKPEGSVR